MSRPIAALIVFSSKCHRCKELHKLIEKLKPDLGDKVAWEDHDISKPAEQASFAAYPLQRIPLIVVRGDGLDWAPPADLWWMGVPSEDDLRRGLSGLWVKNNTQHGGSNGTSATPSIHAVRAPVSISLVKKKHKDYEHYAVLDQPMSESIKNLLRFNIEGLLSNLLAMEEHLAQIQRSAINDSWCIQKHRMTGRNHHLLEAVNHAAEVSPALSEKFKGMLKYYDENTENPDIACVRKLRNWIREEVGDKTLGSGCPLCASDTAGAEKLVLANGEREHKEKERREIGQQERPRREELMQVKNGHGMGWEMLESQFEAQKRFLTPPTPTKDSQVVRPTVGGQDLENVFRNRDAHLKLEEGEIVADVFDSEIKEPAKAHLESENASNDEKGADEITHFLRTFGFDVVVKPGRSTNGHEPKYVPVAGRPRWIQDESAVPAQNPTFFLDLPSGGRPEQAKAWVFEHPDGSGPYQVEDPTTGRWLDEPAEDLSLEQAFDLAETVFRAPGHLKLRPFKTSLVPAKQLGDYNYAYRLKATDGMELVSDGGRDLSVPAGEVWISSSLHDFRDLVMEHILAEVQSQHEGYDYQDAHRAAELWTRGQLADDPRWRKMVMLMGKLHLLEVMK